MDFTAIFSQVMGLFTQFIQWISSAFQPTVIQPNSGTSPSLTNVSHRITGGNAPSQTVEASSPVAALKRPDGIQAVAMLDVGHGGKVVDSNGVEVSADKLNSITLIDFDKKVQNKEYEIVTKGFDPGAVSPIDGTTEFEINLRHAIGIREKLTAQGWDAQIYAQGKDSKSNLGSALQKRSQQANAIDADLFITVHNNKYVGTAKGGEVFYGDGTQSKLVAETIGENMRTFDDSFRRVQHESNTAVKRLGVFQGHNDSRRALVLLEGGFLDHPEDLPRIQGYDFIEKYSNAVAQGASALAKNRGFARETMTASVDTPKQNQGADVQEPSPPTIPNVKLTTIVHARQ